MKRTGRFLISTLILAAALPVFGRETDGAGKPASGRFSLEIFGGFSLLNPQDLNLWADYENGYLDYTYSRQYEYLVSVKRGFYTYTRTPASGGAVASLKDGLPFGIRAVYDLGRTVSFVLGIEYISGSKSSSYSVEYVIRDLDPDKIHAEDALSRDIEYPAFRLSARAWVPQAGIRARLRWGRRVAFAGQITGGWVFARGEVEKESTIEMADRKEFWQSTTSAIGLQGTGNGFAAEAVGQVRISIHRRADVYLEAGYAYRRTAEVTGSYSYYYRREDANSEPYEYRYSYPQGTWRTNRSSATNTWGRWDFANIAFFPDGSQDFGSTQPFRLDLSGFQFRAGLAWRF